MRELRKYLKKESGASTVLVLIVACVLVILGTVLSTNIVQWFRIVRSEETVEYAFTGAHTAVERSFLNIHGNFTDPLSTYLSGVTWSGDDTAYADALIARMNANDPANPYVRHYNDIEVFETSGQPKVEADIEFGRDKNALIRRSADGSKLILPIAVTVKASLRNGFFASFGRKVYASREFQYPVPDKFFLNAAVYTLGDVFATNGITAKVHGNVNAFGTSPVKKHEVNQYFYGGIYAKKGSGSITSTLLIEGNAYTRSFIRAGMYSGLEDGSKVYIQKDAVAQSLQIFGKSDALLVGRNAYTFDDLEVDGENSILGVNGSFFGLSWGDGANHDASSAIVNAAPIHYNNSDDSKKSRIVINGDVLVNGATFKVDPVTGVAQYQMEDASMSWRKDTDIAAYKAYTGPSAVTGYISYLKGLGLNLQGFLNLIQMWDGVPLTANWEPELDGWLSEIKKANAVPGVNTWTGVGGLRAGAVSGGTAVKNDVTGFSNYAMAANDRIYYMDKSSIATSDIKKVKYLKNTYQLDGVSGLSVTPVSMYWNDAADLDDSLWSGTYCDTVSGGLIRNKLQELKSKLMGVTDVFCSRDYPPQADGSVIVPADNIVNTFQPGLGTVGPATPQNLFAYLQAWLNYNFTDSNPYVKIYPDDGIDSPALTLHNVNGELSVEAAADGITYADSYFLVVNNDPENVLVVDSSFKGIILSAGRVEIRKGASVEGAILASGRGYDPAGNVKGSAAGYYTEGGSPHPRIPIIRENGSNSTNFENGDYAGVLFNGNAGAGTEAIVNFPGREPLLNSFLAEGLNLFPIF